MVRPSAGVDDIRDALQALLGDPGYRLAAHSVGHRITERSGAAQAAGVLAPLLGSKP